MTVNIASPEHKANVYPFYARLRVTAPVHSVTLPDKQTAWLVSRYDDVVQVLKDERFAKDMENALTREQLGKQPWIPAMFKPLKRNMWPCRRQCSRWRSGLVLRGLESLPVTFVKSL
jgi:cytochrome P450